VRRWNRHKIDIRLKVIVKVSGGTTETVFGRGNSLSPGGIGAYIPTTITSGSRVDLELTFPYSANEVTVKALVRGSEGFRYNLEFVEVPEDVQRIIRESCSAADAAEISP
jgi:PilZ domain-containing protein